MTWDFPACYLLSILYIMLGLVAKAEELLLGFFFPFISKKAKVGP